MGSVSLRPPLLGPEQPRWEFVRPGSDNSSGSGTGGERLLLTVCVHGNEPCGLLVSTSAYKMRAGICQMTQMHHRSTPDASAGPTAHSGSGCCTGDAASTAQSLQWPAQTLSLHAPQAANELLDEGFFDSAAGEGAWPHTWDRLTVLLGNPAGLQAGKRPVDDPHAVNEALTR